MFRFQFSASTWRESLAAPAHARSQWRVPLASLFATGMGLSLLLGSPASAKTKAPIKPSVAKFTSSSASSSAASALGPGDVIAVTVLRHTELSVESLQIPASGQINLPDAGAVRIAGQTPTQAAQSIARALSGTLVAPEVTVELKQARLQLVVVIGTVAKPNSYSIGQNWRISNALAAAGGLPGRVDETAATLTHKGGQPLTVDLQTIQDDPSSAKNLFLREGDTLTIRALDTKTITVTGDVLKPGSYSLRSAPRLVEALTLAGNPKEDVNRTNATLFRRNGQEVALDLAQAETQAESSSNIRLQEGDLIIVKSVPLLQVTVAGPTTFVRSPGNFQLAPGSGVAQAVAQAGLAVLPEDVVATVVRGRSIIPIDLRRAGIDPAANIPLQSGDLININEPDVIRVQVAGAVNTPRALRLAPGTTLLDALNRAGGVSIAVQPEEARIAIVRTPSARAQLVGASTSTPVTTFSNALDTPAPWTGAGTSTTGTMGTLATSTTGTPAVGAPQTQIVGDREAITVNAVALLRGNDLTQNVTLQDGDLISVTQVKTPTVIVSGQIAKPGPYQIAEGEGIAQLMARAGGPTGDAALTRVVLQRNGVSRSVDAYDSVTLGQKSDVTLQNGDLVTVPQNTARVVVMNAVQRPGSYPLPERGTLTVTDALALAGGPRDRASVHNVVLLRPNPAAEKGVERQVISLDRISKGDLSQNVTLRPGDIVYVPEARASGASSILAGLGQVISTVTGFRYLTGG